MASPFLVGVASTFQGTSFSSGQRVSAILCDGSVLASRQSAVGVLTLAISNNPTAATPTFADLAQTFAIASDTTIIHDVYVLNNGTTTSDVWVVYSGNDGTNGANLLIAHAVYTASGASWAWSNTASVVSALGVAGFGFPSVMWAPGINSAAGNLIVCWRDGSATSRSVQVSWTATKDGSTGWSAKASIGSSTVQGAHAVPLLRRGTNVGGSGSTGTLLIYCLNTGANTDNLAARFLPDSAASAAAANWGAEALHIATGQNIVYSVSCTIDPATGNVHVAYASTLAGINGAVGASYSPLTISGTTITWGTRTTVDTGAIDKTALGIDTTGRLYMLLDTGTQGTSGVINERFADSPYTSWSGSLATVFATVADGAPHLPADYAMTTYLPFIAQRGGSPFNEYFDNTITLGTATPLEGSQPMAFLQRTLPYTVQLRTQRPFMSRQRQAFPPVPPIPWAGSMDAVSSMSGTLTLTSLPWAGTMNAVSSMKGTFYTPGLVVTTETQSGISGGPPGNNTTQTTTTWIDQLGNGWAVGMIPAYGGALIAPWYEIAAYIRSISQTSLATSAADGFIHLLAQSGTPPGPAGVFSGTEDLPYTLTELVPTGQAFRRYFDSGNMVTSNPALTWRVRTCIFPGDPGHYYHRIDLTNASGSAVNLNGLDGLEIAMLGGLTQALQGGASAWIPANGFYATVAGTETAWPGPDPTSTAADPDYVYITPVAGSGLKLSALAIRAKASNGGLSIASLTGASAAAVDYLTNTNRLKVKEFVTMASVPGSTTFTLYYLESRPRNYSAGQASAIAADYLNPDASSIVAVGTAASPFFSLDEGSYVVAASGNVVKLTHTFPTNVTKRWSLNYKITNYTAQAAPQVYLGGVLLDNLSALTYVDTGNQIAYVVLMPNLVASSAVAPDLNNAQLVIQQPSGVLTGSMTAIGGMSGALSTVAGAISGATTAVSSMKGTLSLAVALAGTATSTAAEAGTLALAEALAGTSGATSTETGTLSLQVALAGASSDVSTESGSLSLAEALAGSSSGVLTTSGNLQALSGAQIAGSSVAVSSMTGSLTLSVGLAGTSRAVSTAAGTLGLALPLAGTSAASASFSGALGLALALAGASAAISSDVGSLTLVSSGGLAGASQAEGRFSATLVLAIALSGAMRAQSSFSGTLGLGSAIDGQVVASVATASRIVPGAAPVSQAGSSVAPVSTVKTTVTVD